MMKLKMKNEKTKPKQFLTKVKKFSEFKHPQLGHIMTGDFGVG
jgi:hypothetical protein